MAKVVKKDKSVVVETKVSDIAKEDVSTLTTKSSKIRFYLAKGYSVSVIAKHMGILYQHVRNVSVTQLKKDMKK